MLSVIMLSVIMLNLIMLSVIMLSVILLSVIMLSVIMLSVIMLNVIMLSVIMISVVMLCIVAKLVLQDFPNIYKLMIFTCSKAFNWLKSPQISDTKFHKSFKILILVSFHLLLTEIYVLFQ